MGILVELPLNRIVLPVEMLILKLSWNGAIFSSSDILHGLIAVPYTHLDVYKRQNCVQTQSGKR